MARTIGAAKRRQRRRARPRQGWRRWGRRLREEAWGADATDAARDWSPVIRWHLPALSLYLLIAAAATFPLILHLDAAVPSDGGDAMMNLWGFWWVREALTHFRNPFETPLVYAPYGAPLYLHTLNPLNGLISLPFQWLFGLTIAYNAVVFISLALAGYFAALLVAHVSGDRVAGFVGGVAYAFSAYQLTHLLGHTNLLSSQWLPAYLLCLLRALETGGRRRTGFIALAIAALVCVTLTDWFYVVFAVLLTIIVAAWYAVARRAVAPLVVGAAIGLPWALLSLPLLLATAAEVRAGISDLPSLGTIRNYSADLLSFGVPSTRHWLLGPLALRVARYGAAPPVEGDIFLGYVPLILAGCALWLARRRAALWCAIAAIFVVLSLGPVLHLNGQWRFGASARSIPLPYSLLLDIPGLSVVRTPVRLALGGTFGLAVLSGLAVAGLRRRWPRLAGGRAQFIFVAALVTLMLAEQLTVPFPLEATAVPNFYRQLAASSAPGTILELPISYKRARSDLYQTVHGRPIVAGYIARRLDYPYRALLPVGGYPPAASDIFAQQTAPGFAPLALAWANIRWIVVYPDDPNYDEYGTNRLLELAADGGPIYEEPGLRVYRPRAATGDGTALSLGDGWYDLERLSDGKTDIRWMAPSAQFFAWYLGGPSATFALRFDAISFNNPRRLEVLLDGRSLGQWRVTETQRFDIPLTLTAGQHTIELRALDAPVTPASVGGNPKDTRPLSFRDQQRLLAAVGWPSPPAAQMALAHSRRGGAAHCFSPSARLHLK